MFTNQGHLIEKSKSSFQTQLIQDCLTLIEAFKAGKLGHCKLPEDNSPIFPKEELEAKIAYFTLPMSLNYQRNSDKLWESAFRTYNDALTREVFSIEKSPQLSADELRMHLLKYRLALQPNKHIATWQNISQTVHSNWGTLSGFLTYVDFDFLTMREYVQVKYKKGFPYLSGPKIFNYWSFVLYSRCDIPLKNKEYIDIAVDTHITKCSVRLGIITQEEATKLPKEKIAERWRTLLSGSNIAPVELNNPLWFWSRNNFTFNLL